MKLRANYFIFPKKGCKSSECEDGLSINLHSGRFCVTDGASEAFDSRHWARLLASTWKLGGEGALLDADSFYGEIISLSKRWKGKWSRSDLPWYVEQKSSQGSYTAFLGIQFKEAIVPDDVFSWEAISLGDCCVFIVDSEGVILETFPMVSQSEFGNFPALISTNFEDESYLKDNLRKTQGVLNIPETMLLMSDAISSWYFGAADDPIKKQVFLSLLNSKDKKGLNEFIDNEMQNNLLRNDDIAIIYIRNE